MKPLEGKVTLITGAGKGIGEAIAFELARLGATVVLCARTANDLSRVAQRIADAGGNALPFPTDVTDVAAVRQLIQTVLSEAGGVDILVNNAGSAVFEPVSDSDPETWWRTVEVNLRGTYLCSRFVLPAMLDRGKGHIVNVLSIASVTPFVASSAYCAAKAGALMFTRVLASEVRAHGVRVTAILPGSTRTPFWDDKAFTPDPSKMMSPERVAETVAFVVTQPEGAVIDEVHVLPSLGIL